MKTLFTRLTYLAVALIVPVLAIYLILIAISLIRANSNLARLVKGLKAIRDNTAPLAQDLSTINSVATTLRSQLTAVDGHLRDVIQAVTGER